MSIRRTREERFPRTGEVYPDEEADPRRFLGEADRSAVMRAQHELVRVVRRLRPVLSFKGV